MPQDQPEPGAAQPGTPPPPRDPETDPAATWVLEPDDVRPLLGRLTASPGAPVHSALAPFTAGPLAAVPQSTRPDVERAVRAARVAQRRWAATPLRERTRVLLRLHDLLLQRQDEVLDLIQLETGKARADAAEELFDVAGQARYHALTARRHLAERGARPVVPGLGRVRVLRHPVGVVGVISPWNCPLSLSLGDALAPLVAGNAVLLRPDPQTTLTALWAAELCAAAGLPTGVLQVVSGGKETGQAVTDAVDHLIFTGSSRVGKEVARRAAGRLASTVLELGGKNAMYVAADVDVDVAARVAVRACFTHAGQLRLAVQRLYVHRDVRGDFVDALVRRTRALRLGAGLDYRSDVGSLVGAAQLARVDAQVQDAVGRGAVLLTGGSRRPDLGPWFYEPTVLLGVPDDALAAREETFGPVVAVREVASDDEAVAAMNDTPYGLHAVVVMRDVRRARALAARLHTGSVAVNDAYRWTWSAYGAPQGGVGASGLGRRHGREAIEACTRTQTVGVHRPGPAAAWVRRVDVAGATGTGPITALLRARRALHLP